MIINCNYNQLENVSNTKWYKIIICQIGHIQDGGGRNGPNGYRVLHFFLCENNVNDYFHHQKFGNLKYFRGTQIWNISVKCLFG